MIFAKKEYEKAINESVFPGLQGGPHEHQIAGVATQLYEILNGDSFKTYIQQVRSNSHALADRLIEHGYTLSTGGTDNHLVLVDLRDKGVTGSVETVCDLADITINKNSVFGDKSALSPGGIRIGTAAMTTRGFSEDDFRKVADLIHHAVNISIEIQKCSGRKLTDFTLAAKSCKDITDLRANVNNFVSDYPMP